MTLWKKATFRLMAMFKPSPVEIPDDLRSRLENARLSLLALFRAMDQIDLSPAEIPQRALQQLFHIDADYAEALWALDQPAGRLNFKVMLRQTLASLDQLPQRVTQLRKNLPPRSHPKLEELEASIRKAFDPKEAYNQVPGHDRDS